VTAPPQQQGQTQPEQAAHLDEEAGMAVYKPLLVLQAHQRWVSCSKFLSGEAAERGAASAKLLTAADDGLVKVWDLAQTSQLTSRQNARLLTSSSCGHAPGRGIFSLDERGGDLVTGSKDRRVCVTRLTPAGLLAPLASFSELHEGVVKSVCWSWQQQEQVQGESEGEQQWQQPVVFASGGQDRRVCVKDTRSGFGGNGGAADLEVLEAHGGGVHTVSWCAHPRGQHWLLSAGYDGLVHVFDMRALGGEGRAPPAPLFSFREHLAPTGTGRRKASSTIVTPCFLSSARVLLPSQFSGALSLHCLASGGTVSRGVFAGDAVPISVTAATRTRSRAGYVVAASNRKGAMHVFCAKAAGRGGDLTKGGCGAD
jgi:hypothetical protein